MTRIIPFVVVGALGFVVQISLLSALTSVAHWPIALATALAVEAAVLVNFAWHCRWTWRDRPVHGGRLAQLARFHVSNGLLPIAGNVLVTVALTQMVDVPPAAANVVAVVLLSAMNFAAADRWVFVSGASVAALLLSTAPAMAASPQGETLHAWNDHVARVEASLPAQMTSDPSREPQGRIVGVPDGSVHEWRGSVLVRNTTVDALVQALQDPEHAPLPQDVAESRLLSRNGDALRVYFKLVRKVIITVTYDTEHDVTHTRLTIARHQPQCRDENRRDQRQGSRFPVAVEFVLALPAGRSGCAGRRGLGLSQPLGAEVGTTGGRAPHRAGRPRVHAADARSRRTDRDEACSGGQDRRASR